MDSWRYYVRSAIDSDTDGGGEEEERMNRRGSCSQQNEIDDDEDENARRSVPYGMSLSSDVNMTTCYKHCQHYFSRYPNQYIHEVGLLFYWMMAGYLEGAPSVAEAMEKGRAILADLKTKWGIETDDDLSLKLSSTPRNPIQCRHKGFCDLRNLGVVDFLNSYVYVPWYASTFNPTKKKLCLNLNIDFFKSLENLEIGSPLEYLNIDFFKSLENLEILNLSQTFVAKLPDMSKLVSLKELLLADCQHFRVMPASLLALTNLETLDLSLPHGCSIDNRQLESKAEGQVPISLRKLVLTNRFGVQKIFPKTILENLEFLDLRGTDVPDWDNKLPAQQPQERIHKPVEIHTVRPDQEYLPSSSDHFEDASMRLEDLISDIQRNLNSAKDTITFQTDDEDFKMHIEMICTNLIYIQANIDRLKSYRHWKSREGLLHKLNDAASYLSRADLQLDFANIKKLHLLVLKLKLLVSPEETNDSKALELTKKKKKSLFVRSTNKKNVADIIKDMKGIGSDFLPSYQSLSDVQKHCLLCFSIFPYDEEGDMNASILKSLVIKKEILIYWWAGEGFIDPHFEETPNPDMRTDEANEQVYAPKRLKKLKTIEEVGKQILKVLVEKQFIEPVMKKRRESGSYYMHPFVHSFVIERAKEEGFFDFDQETCNLTPHFSLSRRACLLKPQDKFLSSCELWARRVSLPKKLARFENVTTLFNVNESMVDIKREWFSKMKNLCVLRLGIWRSENADLIEAEDLMFFQDLKRMKQLRLLSLQGWPTIFKLPDSVCQLSNLIILDLKECIYLEELPAGIGSLKSLTHLDISNCPLLTKLPKGIKLLSKLEVLRGLVITGQHAARGSQGRNSSTPSHWWEKTMRCTIQGLFRFKKNEVCTLKDLLTLERLRELSLVVNIRMFPNDEDLKVFKEMKQLRKLKILWEKSIRTEDTSASTEKEALKERHPSPNGGQHTEESKHLDHIEKLEMLCFPNEIAPSWVNPSELKNLKRLHIIGGNLRELQGGISENKWNVATLRLKYLHNLNIRWIELKTMFPQLMYLEKHQCDQLVDFPCDDAEGVWRSES